MKFCAHSESEAFDPPPGNVVGSATHAGGRMGCGALLMPVDLELSEKYKKKRK